MRKFPQKTNPNNKNEAVRNQNRFFTASFFFCCEPFQAGARVEQMKKSKGYSWGDAGKRKLLYGDFVELLYGDFVENSCIFHAS